MATNAVPPFGRWDQPSNFSKPPTYGSNTTTLVVLRSTIYCQKIRKKLRAGEENQGLSSLSSRGLVLHPRVRSNDRFDLVFHAPTGHNPLPSHSQRFKSSSISTKTHIKSPPPSILFTITWNSFHLLSKIKRK